MAFRKLFSLWLVGLAGLLGLALIGITTFMPNGTVQDRGQKAAAANSGPDCPPPSMRFDQRSCFLNGRVDRDLTLTSDVRWVLTGKVTVGRDVGIRGEPDGGPTLTIEPGTRVVGMSGPDVLVISRGARIVAEGSRQEPIVMTTVGEQSGRGRWGGLVINGQAPVNGCDTAPCELKGEGRSGLYGGGRPGDSSGVLRYVQVRHAGHRFTGENELNGIAFQGVGSGTRVDHVQVHNNADDGVELFGGTVDVSHLLLTGNADDSLDWTNGWRGTATNVLIRQAGSADRAIEGDNNGAAMDAEPRSAPVLANLTILGSGTGSQAILLREGSAAEVHNALIAGAFPDGCVDVDDPATAKAGRIRFRSSVLDCDGSPAFVADPGEGWDVAQVVGWEQGSNRRADVALSGLRPAAGSGLRQAPGRGPAAPYLGALGQTDWTRGWSHQPSPGSVTARAGEP